MVGVNQKLKYKKEGALKRTTMKADRRIKELMI